MDYTIPLFHASSYPRDFHLRELAQERAETKAKAEEKAQQKKDFVRIREADS